MEKYTNQSLGLYENHYQNIAPQQYRLHTEYSRQHSNPSASMQSHSQQSFLINEEYQNMVCEPTEQHTQENSRSQTPLMPVSGVPMPAQQTAVDPSAIIKQMSQEQIQQLLRDPEIAKILQNQCMNLEIQGEEFEMPDRDTPDDFSYEGQMVVLTTGVGEGEVNFDNMQVQTTNDDESDEEGNLAFQLFDGEEMNAQMANFIGIHMLNDLVDSTGEEGGPFNAFNGNEGSTTDEQYQCPQTGAHFMFDDLVRRIRQLQKRRAIIDRAIEEETRLKQQQQLQDLKQQQRKLLAQRDLSLKQLLTDGDEIIPVQTQPDEEALSIIPKTGNRKERSTGAETGKVNLQQAKSMKSKNQMQMLKRIVASQQRHQPNELQQQEYIPTQSDLGGPSPAYLTHDVRDARMPKQKKQTGGKQIDPSIYWSHQNPNPVDEFQDQTYSASFTIQNQPPVMKVPSEKNISFAKITKKQVASTMAEIMRQKSNDHSAFKDQQQTPLQNQNRHSIKKPQHTRVKSAGKPNISYTVTKNDKKVNAVQNLLNFLGKNIDGQKRPEKKQPQPIQERHSSRVREQRSQSNNKLTLDNEAASQELYNILKGKPISQYVQPSRIQKGEGTQARTNTFDNRPSSNSKGTSQAKKPQPTAQDKKLLQMILAQQSLQQKQSEKIKEQMSPQTNKRKSQQIPKQKVNKNNFNSVPSNKPPKVSAILSKEMKAFQQLYQDKKLGQKHQQIIVSKQNLKANNQSSKPSGPTKTAHRKSNSLSINKNFTPSNAAVVSKTDQATLLQIAQAQQLQQQAAQYKTVSSTKPSQKPPMRQSLVINQEPRLSIGNSQTMQTKHKRVSSHDQQQFVQHQRSTSQSLQASELDILASFNTAQNQTNQQQQISYTNTKPKKVNQNSLSSRQQRPVAVQSLGKHIENLNNMKVRRTTRVETSIGSMGGGNQASYSFINKRSSANNIQSGSKGGQKHRASVGNAPIAQYVQAISQDNKDAINSSYPKVLNQMPQSRYVNVKKAKPTTSASLKREQLVKKEKMKSVLQPKLDKRHIMVQAQVALEDANQLSRAFHSGNSYDNRTQGSIDKRVTEL